MLWSVLLAKVTCLGRGATFVAFVIYALLFVAVSWIQAFVCSWKQFKLSWRSSSTRGGKDSIRSCWYAAVFFNVFPKAVYLRFSRLSKCVFRFVWDTVSGWSGLFLSYLRPQLVCFCCLGSNTTLRGRGEGSSEDGRKEEERMEGRQEGRQERRSEVCREKGQRKRGSKELKEKTD